MSRNGLHYLNRFKQHSGRPPASLGPGPALLPPLGAVSPQSTAVHKLRKWLKLFLFTKFRKVRRSLNIYGCLYMYG